MSLAGSLAQKDAKGVETLTPITADTQIKPDQEIRYDITATNGGSSAALRLAPMDRLPAGVEYVAGSAKSSADYSVAFSLDGGKTWAAIPMIKVKTKDGIVEKKADPASYTAIRWTMLRPLAPHASSTYSFEARVK